MNATEYPPPEVRHALALAKLIEDGDQLEAQTVILTLDHDTQERTLLAMASILAAHLAAGCTAMHQPPEARADIQLCKAIRLKRHLDKAAERAVKGTTGDDPAMLRKELHRLVGEIDQFGEHLLRLAHESSGAVAGRGPAWR